MRAAGAGVFALALLAAAYLAYRAAFELCASIAAAVLAAALFAFASIVVVRVTPAGRRADDDAAGKRHQVDGHNVVAGVLAATPADAIVIAARTYARRSRTPRTSSAASGTGRSSPTTRPRTWSGAGCANGRSTSSLSTSTGSPGGCSSRRSRGSWPRIYRVVPASQ